MNDEKDFGSSVYKDFLDGFEELAQIYHNDELKKMVAERKAELEQEDDGKSSDK